MRMFVYIHVFVQLCCCVSVHVDIKYIFLIITIIVSVTQKFKKKWQNIELDQTLIDTIVNDKNLTGSLVSSVSYNIISFMT
jgi:hypothetical protein